MRTFMLLAIAALLFSPLSYGQNYVQAAQTFTTTGQTGTAIPIFNGAASGLISVSGTFTTATWGIQGSSNGGATWNYLLTANSTTPTTTATTETVTAAGLFLVNLAGITNIRLVTSGTFTGTNLVLQVTYTNASNLLLR